MNAYGYIISRVLIWLVLLLAGQCLLYGYAQEPVEQDEIAVEGDQLESESQESEPSEAGGGQQDEEIDLGTADVLGQASLAFVIGNAHALTTLSAQELAGASSVAEALERVPGLDVRFQGGQGQMSTAQVRGARANQALVLVDGQPLAAGAAVDLSTIPLPAVERIEILRGPEAAQFGAGALGGVVNFITRRPRGETAETGQEQQFPLNEHMPGCQVRQPKTSLAELELSSGSFGSAGAAFTWSDSSTAVGAAHRQSKNRYSFKRTGGGSAIRQNNDAMHDSFWAAWNTHGLDQRLNVNLLDRGVPGSAEFPTLNARLKQEQLAWQGSRDRWRAGVSATWTHYTDPTPYLHTGAIDSNSTRLRIEFASGLLAMHRGSWGVKPFVEYIDSSEYGVHERYGLEAARHWELTIGGGIWSLDGGISAASDQGVAPSARFSWTKSIEHSTSAYTAMGYAVRFPDFEELYLTGNGPVQGNQNLDPERALSYEAGIKAAWERARLDTSLFYTDYEDTIIFAPISGYAVRASNTGKAHVAGIEALLDCQLAEGFWWRTAYTWLPISEYDNGMPLSGRAKYHANTRLEWTAEEWRAAMDWDFTGSMAADLFGNLVLKPRMLCGFEIERDWDTNALSLSVSNIFEEQARDAWNYPLPGRALQILWSVKL